MNFRMDRFFIACFLLAGLLFQTTGGLEALINKLLNGSRPTVLRTWQPQDPRCYPEECPMPLGPVWHILQKLCCAHPLYYHCQEMDDGRKFRTCMDAENCPAGTFADMEVIRDRKYPAEPLCQPCPLAEFQPQSTLSYMFDFARCHHRRRNCREVNAEILIPGSAKADDVCRCPYLNGYRPVSRDPRLSTRDCHTFNSSLGCICKHRPCPGGQIMTEGAENQYPQLCLGQGCPRSSSEDESWLLFLQDIHRSYGLWIVGLFVVVVYGIYRLFLYLWRGPARYDIMVCIIIPSSKICEFVFHEIQNSLPLLERLYGPLTLDHDPEFTYITVIVRPTLAKRKFSLMQFIRDLFGAVSIAKYLNGTSEDLRIIAVHGTSSEINTASFREAALKERGNLPVNTGKVILRFSDELVEDQLIHELKTAKRDFKTIFMYYKLKFGSIKRGSIDFVFTFTESESFDSMAMEQKIKELVRDLCSNDSFKQLVKREDVRVEFICKAKLGTVSVVQAQNLCIQVGMQNNVYINVERPQSLDENDQDEFDEDTPGSFFSYNILSISPRNLSIHGAGEQNDHQEAEEYGLDPNSRVIPVVIKCDAATADELHAEWSNHLPLLERIYQSCRIRMRRTEGGIVWELGSIVQGYFVLPDITSFINDLFRTQRTKDIMSRSDVKVNVHVSQHTEEIVALSRERPMMEARRKKVFLELIDQFGSFCLNMMFFILVIHLRFFTIFFYFCFIPMDILTGVLFIINIYSDFKVLSMTKVVQALIICCACTGICYFLILLFYEGFPLA